MKETDYAYLAGVLDCDGWFSVSKTVSRVSPSYSPTYSPNVGAVSTSEPFAHWLLETFGGRIDRKKAHGLGTKPKYSWQLRVRELSDVLPFVIPYLRNKRRQAELILELMATKADKKRPLQPSLVLYREQLRQEIRSLNATHHPM